MSLKPVTEHRHSGANAIIDYRLPKRWHQFGLRDIEDAWPEAQRAAILRFCEAVEKQATGLSASLSWVAFKEVRDELIATQQEKK